MGDTCLLIYLSIANKIEVEACGCRGIGWGNSSNPGAKDGDRGNLAIFRQSARLMFMFIILVELRVFLQFWSNVCSFLDHHDLQNRSTWQNTHYNVQLTIWTFHVFTHFTHPMARASSMVLDSHMITIGLSPFSQSYNCNQRRAWF